MSDILTRIEAYKRRWQNTSCTHSTTSGPVMTTGPPGRRTIC